MPSSWCRVASAYLEWIVKSEELRFNSKLKTQNYLITPFQIFLSFSSPINRIFHILAEKIHLNQLLTLIN